MRKTAIFMNPPFRRLLLIAFVIGLATSLVAIGFHLSVSASQKSELSTPVDIQVMIDAAKTFDLNSTGTLAVAILGRPDLNVHKVDPKSIRFAGASVMRSKNASVPASRPGSSDTQAARQPVLDIVYQDVNQDGHEDLIAAFAIPSLKQLRDGAQEAWLEARTYNGHAIKGSQSLQISDASPHKVNKHQAFVPLVSGTPFCNNSAITINDTDAATPYPSTIDVTGLTGVISNLTVSVSGFNHGSASDVSVLLVSPTGQKMMLWSQAGAGGMASNANLTFDDGATAYLPLSGNIVTGTYKPTNRAGNNTSGDPFFPDPAPQASPASPYAATLASFKNANPNGTWSLYVVDNALGGNGSIDGGWCLNITTAPSVSTCASTLLQGAFLGSGPTQVDRLNRDGTPSECVGTPKTCPAAFGGSSILNYQTYTLTNHNPSATCVTVTTTASCGSEVFTSAYLTSYTPPPPGGNLCTNYLADAGTSPTDTSGIGNAFSFTVPSGATFVLVVNEINGVGCGAFSLLVEGDLCCPNDTQPPVITCPASVTTTATTGGISAVVTYPPPTATDNCEVASLGCTPPSGSIFTLGTTTVTCTATDLTGNSASCSFSVTVVVFNASVQDESARCNGVALFNTSTGAYRFCCGGTVFTGTAAVVRKGNTYTLTQGAGTQRVLIMIDLSTKKGSATLQSPPGVIRCTIRDNDITNNTCTCGG